MSYDYFGLYFFPDNYWADEYWPLYGSTIIVIPGPGDVPGIDYTSEYGQLHYTFSTSLLEYTSEGSLLEYTAEEKIEYTE